MQIYFLDYDQQPVLNPGCGVCKTVSSLTVTTISMGLLNRAIEHYKVYGFYNLLGAASTKLFNRDIITPVLFPVWYGTNTFLSPWFEYNGVTVNLEHEAISTAVKREFMLGYETAELRLIERNLKKSANVVELGGGLGITSCFIDGNVDVEGKHFSVEANPELKPVLEAHKARNKATFEIIQKAYSPTDGSVTFHLHDDVYSSGTQSRKSEYDDSVTVSTIDLRTICGEYSLDEFDLIADIEGEEHSLFSEELDLIKRRCRLLIVELHDVEDATVADGRKQLLENDFELIDQTSNVFVFRNTLMNEKVSEVE